MHCTIESYLQVRIKLLGVKESHGLLKNNKVLFFIRSCASYAQDKITLVSVMLSYIGKLVTTVKWFKSFDCSKTGN